MTDINFKVLYAYSPSSTTNASYIFEIKRLDLPSDAPLNQKFLWLMINVNGVIPFDFISMKKLNEKSSIEGVNANNDTNDEHDQKWSEYRQFKQGEFYFNPEKGEFSYDCTIFPEFLTTTDESLDVMRKIEYSASQPSYIDSTAFTRIKAFLENRSL